MPCASVFFTQKTVVPSMPIDLTPATALPPSDVSVNELLV